LVIELINKPKLIILLVLTSGISKSCKLLPKTNIAKKDGKIFGKH